VAGVVPFPLYEVFSAGFTPTASDRNITVIYDGFNHVVGFTFHDEWCWGLSLGVLSERFQQRHVKDRV
jgi:hypothetical protein